MQREDGLSYNNFSFVQIQHGVVHIPKYSNRKRLKENFDIFDFELTPEEVTLIDSVNQNFWIFHFENKLTQIEQ
jgi:diketogulonate reductase-like aldo/keto reductase